MPGSTITHFTSSHNMEHVTNDIELLPTNAPMVDLTNLHEKKESTSTDGNKNENEKKPNVVRRIIRRRRRQKKDGEKTMFEMFGSSAHLQRMDVDIQHLSLSIAGNIENQEQWKEFFDNSQGQALSSILQCVRDVANEIRMGADVYDNMDNASMLDRATRRENAFVAACSAVKVLRDLCSIDQNWASFITHEILSSDGDDGKERKENTESISFLDDLTIMLKYANEADIFDSKKIFRLRRELRARGIKRFGTRRQRRRKFVYCVFLLRFASLFTQKNNSKHIYIIFRCKEEMYSIHQSIAPWNGVGKR